MSDTERQAGGGGAGEAGGASRLPARNMADIARLFLDGARPAGAGNGTPRRTPPNERSATPAKGGEQRNDRNYDASRAMVMLGLATAGLEPAGWKLLLEAARGIAEEQGTTVAVTGLLGSGSQRTFITDIVGVESAEELPVIRAASDAHAGAPDMQIARALHRLRPAVGVWLIVAPDPESRAFPVIASILHDWLLACPTDNDGLIAGYQFLKRAWVKGALGTSRVTPSVYLLSEDYAQAAMVHKRLRKASQEFLKTDLSLAGAGPARQGSAGHEAIRVLTVHCEGPEDALWAAILDELCPMGESDEDGADNEIETALEQVTAHATEVTRQSRLASEMALDHLAQVLDPEERAALAADFEEAEEPMPVAVARRRVEASVRVEPKEIPVPVMKTERRQPVAEPKNIGRGEVRAEPEVVERVGVTAAARPEMMAEGQRVKSEAPSLRAFDVESAQDRQTQWQAVERSIWDFSPRCALLDAKPPMSWATETCISIDAEGRVNVWTLYKDGASWFALREWASEHRNLLALTRRDLVISREADVAVHIVLPLEEEGAGAPGAAEAGVVGVMMRTAARNVHMYRLRLVQWNTRRGLLVVPIA